MDMGLVALISVGVNALVAVFGPFVARKLANQANKLEQAERAAEVLSNGIEIIETAVEQNKDALSRTGAGNKIAATIKQYGPACKEIVDVARTTAKAIREQGAGYYEAERIAEAREEREERIRTGEIAR